MPRDSASEYVSVDEGEEGGGDEDSAGEAWEKTQSFMPEPSPSAGSGSFGNVIYILANTAATGLVSGFLLTLADHVFLLLVIVALAAIYVKVGRDLLAAFMTTHGRWRAFVLNALDIVFLIAFFSTTVLAITLFTGLFFFSPTHAVAAVFIIVFVLSLLFLFLSYPTFGLLTQPRPVATRPTH